MKGQFNNQLDLESLPSRKNLILSGENSLRVANGYNSNNNGTFDSFRRHPGFMNQTLFPKHISPCAAELRLKQLLQNKNVQDQMQANSFRPSMIQS